MEIFGQGKPLLRGFLALPAEPLDLDEESLGEVRRLESVPGPAWLLFVCQLASQERLGTVGKVVHKFGVQCSVNARRRLYLWLLGSNCLFLVERLVTS